MAKEVLIVVDMLNDFMPGGALPVPGVEDIVPHIAARVAQFRAAGQPIIFLGDNHAENDKEFERFPKHCVAGTKGSYPIKELEFGKNLNDIFIAKTRYSGFYNTGLAEVLAHMIQGRPGVVEVCGVCTSICVMDTIGGLANRDYKTRIYKNCVADLTPESNEFCLKRMEMIYGTEVL